jgi:ribonuclease D
LSAALITDNAWLAQVCEELGSATICALDTEFVWRNTYKPLLGLIQVAAPGGPEFLVDPLKITDYSPLTKVLQAPGCLKMLHACSQDLPILRDHLALPVNMLDTQIAASFCGYAYQISYAKLAFACLGIEPDKSAQRSNWLRRPLTDKQLLYATQDVTALLEIYKVLQEKLESSGRMEWALAESADFANATMAGLERPTYLKIKGYGRCQGREFWLLQRLATWRDETAQKRDCPPRWVLDDPTMLALARRQPQSRNQLFSLPDSDQRGLNRYGRDVLPIIEEAQDVPAEEWPKRERRAAPSASEKEELERLGKKLDAIGEATGIAREMLLSRQVLTQLVRDPATAESAITGWRAELLSDLLG